MILEQQLAGGAPAPSQAVGSAAQRWREQLGVAAPSQAAGSAAQRWREQLGVAAPSQAAGSAAQRWRERLGVAAPSQAAGSTAQRWHKQLLVPETALVTRTVPSVPPIVPGLGSLLTLLFPLTLVTALKPAALAHKQQSSAKRRALPEPGLPPELAEDSALMAASRVLRLNVSNGADGTGFVPLVMLSQAADRSCALLSAALALTLAQEGRRTLLVDADLLTPMLHTLFGLDRQPGLTDLLDGGPAAGVPAVAVADKLWVLPAGSSSVRPVSTALPTVTQHLASAYDALIFHATAPARSTLGLELARQVGTVIFTVRAGIDIAEPLRHLRMALERAGVSVLGFALVEAAP